MANSKGQNDLNQDADDFMSEFLHFVHQHKGNATSQTNEFSILSECKSQADSNFIFDLDIPSVVVTLPEEVTSIESSETGQNCLADVNTSDEVLDILSEPMISSVNRLDSFLYPAKNSRGHSDLSLGGDTTVVEVLSSSVTAELEKVLSDPHAFDDIGLYLECSEDDIQSIQIDDAKKNTFASGNFCLHAGNSSIQSDISLKISFPIVVNEEEDDKRCSSCRLSFTSGGKLLNHLDTSYCKVLLCKECIYNTKSVKRFLTHMKTRHNISDVLFNDFVDKSTATIRPVSDLEMVRLKENNTGSDESKIANAQSRQDDISEHHVRARMETLKFPCRFCDYTGKSAKLLKMHHQNLHNLNRGLYRCKSCAFTCLQRRTFDAHCKKHEQIFLFDCQECKKCFVTLSALNRHSKIHRIARDFQCSLCNKNFKIRSTLTDHMRKIHKIVGSASSDLVNYSDYIVQTATKTNLDNSLNKTCGVFVAGTNETAKMLMQGDKRSLTSDINPSEDGKNSKPINDTPLQLDIKRPNKRFICTWPNCGKQFRDNFNLNNHFYRHSATKKLSCLECDFQCIQKGHLKNHVKTKHVWKEMKGNTCTK